MLTIGKDYNVLVKNNQMIISGKFLGVVNHYITGTYYVIAIDKELSKMKEIGSGFQELDHRRCVDAFTGKLSLEEDNINNNREFITDIIRLIITSLFNTSDYHYVWCRKEDVILHTDPSLFLITKELQLEII